MSRSVTNNTRWERLVYTIDESPKGFVLLAEAQGVITILHLGVANARKRIKEKNPKNAFNKIVISPMSRARESK